MTIRPVYTIAIEVEVYDPQDLWSAARVHALTHDGLGEQEFIDECGSKDDPDLGRCLQMILDPGASPDGCSIIESRVE